MNDLRTKINWLDRSKVVEILQTVASIHCRDDEPDVLLRDVLFANIEDGTISEEDLE